MLRNEWAYLVLNDHIGEDRGLRLKFEDKR
jgi:hypothetical protein